MERQAVGLSLYKAHRRFRRAVNLALGSLDLEIRHLMPLIALAHDGPATQRQLIALLDVDKSSMVKIVDKLEADGLVRRQRSTEDRRAFALMITDAGRERVKAGQAILGRVAGQVMADVSPEEEAKLVALLDRIGDAAIGVAEEFAQQ